MMKRLEVRYRIEAVADFEDIFRFILRASGHRGTAERFILRIRERCQRIGDAPLSGAARNDLRKRLRTVPFEHTAVIAYRIVDETVEITNVFYGRRDYEALYRGHVSDERPE